MDIDIDKDKLLKLTADEWDTLSDEKLKTILLPYFTITKPSPENRLLFGESDRPVIKPSHRKIINTQAMMDEMAMLMKRANIPLPPIK